MGCCSSTGEASFSEDAETNDNALDTADIVEVTNQTGVFPPAQIITIDNFNNAPKITIGNITNPQSNALKSGMEEAKWMDDLTTSIDTVINADVVITKASINCTDFNKNIEEFIRQFTNSNQYEWTLDGLQQFKLNLTNPPGGVKARFLLHKKFNSKENTMIGIRDVSRIMTGEKNHIQDIYLVPGYLREIDIDIPTEIGPIIEGFVGLSTLHLQALGINWKGQKEDSQKFAGLLVKALEIESSGNIGYECILAQRSEDRYNESKDCWYLWWFVSDESKDDKDCIVIRFSVHKTYEESSDEEEMYGGYR